MSEFEDLGEFDYKGFDPAMVERALLHNFTHRIKSLTKESASNSMPLVMMKAFKLDPTPEDYDQVLSQFAKAVSIIQDMAYVIEELLPIDEFEPPTDAEKERLVSVVKAHPLFQKALMYNKETGEEKLARALKEGNRLPYNG